MRVPRQVLKPMIKSQRWLPVVSLAIGLALTPQRAFAQAPDEPAISEEELNKSHQVFPFPADIDQKHPLLNRLQGRQLVSFLEEYTKKGQVDQEKLADLIRDLKIDVGEAKTKMPEGLQAFLEKMQQPDGVKKEELKKLLAELRRLQDSRAGGDGGASSKNNTQPQAGETAANPTGGQAAAGGGGGGSEPDAQDSGAGSPLAERLIRLAEKLGPALRKSPALQRVMKDLSMYAGDEDPRWQKMAEGMKGMEERLGGWGQSLYLDRIHPPSGFSWPDSWTPSALPKLSFPGGNNPASPPGSGTAAGSSPGSAPQGWEAILAILGLLGLAVVAAKMLARMQGRQADLGDSGWRLGPWPVNPAAIATREELIRAFEYLSLLNLGPAARNWNHLAIAERLKEAVPHALPGSTPAAAVASTGNDAANELASLYERARYAPPNDVLPDAALLTARRDLCLLAGVSSA
jgi:hypothetical protein